MSKKEDFEQLIEAIVNNDSNKVEELINQGVSVNGMTRMNIEGIKDECKTPLMISIAKGNDKITDLLLDNGARVKFGVWPESMNSTALHYAVNKGDFKLVNKLVEKGANLDIRGGEKNITPLELALEEGYFDIAGLLIEKGAKYGKRDERIIGNEKLLSILRKREEKDEEKRQEIINKLKREVTENKELMSKFKSNNLGKVIEKYVDRKMYDIIGISRFNIDELADFFILDNYRKEERKKEIKENIEKENIKEITIDEMKKIWDTTPIYIRGISNALGDEEHNLRNTVSIGSRGEKGVDTEIRKTLREKGHETYSKIQSEKSGNSFRCCTMVNFGKAKPLINVGEGIINEDLSKVYLANGEDTHTEYYPEEGIVRSSENPERVLKPIEEQVNNLFNSLKNEEKTNYSEVVMDVTNKDVKFLYWCGGDDREKLKVLYLMKRYKEETGRQLPIFQYKQGEKDYFEKTDFTKEEIINLLIDVKNGTVKQSDLELLMAFNDELMSNPEVCDILKKFVHEKVEKGSIDKELVKYAGIIGGSEYQEKVFEKYLEKFSIYIGKRSSGYNFKYTYTGDRFNKYEDLVIADMSDVWALATTEKARNLLKGKFEGIIKNLSYRIAEYEIMNSRRYYWSYETILDRLKLLDRGPNFNLMLISAIKRNNENFTKALLECGADVNVIDETGNTALMYAVERGNGELVNMLIENGADVSKISNEDVDNILGYAISKGNEKVAKLLIENGADVNKEDENGNTALMYAVEGGNGELINMLIENGADVSKISNGDVNATLYYAIFKGNEKVVKLLLESGTDVTAALMEAVEEGASKISNEILDDILYYTISKGNEKIVKLLIENGADVNTALMYALDIENKEIVSMLIENGADVNKADKEGITPIKRVKELKNEKLIKIIEKAEKQNALKKSDRGVNISSIGSDTSNTQKNGYVSVKDRINAFEKIIQDTKERESQYNKTNIKINKNSVKSKEENKSLD